ncbi:MAG: hypothetical protein AAFS07_17230 [Pseudomonadota bacterium]
MTRLLLPAAALGLAAVLAVGVAGHAQAMPGAQGVQHNAAASAADTLPVVEATLLVKRRGFRHRRFGTPRRFSERRAFRRGFIAGRATAPLARKGPSVIYRDRFRPRGRALILVPGFRNSYVRGGVILK